jgi:uncharacterized membrane protein YbhN (UPF0104 family)
VSKILRFVISVGLLGWLAARTDWDQIGRAFHRLRPEWWLAAVGLYVAVQVLSAYRWRLLAGPLGFDRPLRHLTGFYFIGMFFNLFLPTSVGGDVVRAWYLDGGSGRRLAAFLSVFIDRLSGLVVLLAMASVAMALCPIALPAWVPCSVWGCGGGALAGLLLLPLLVRCTGRFSRARRLAQAARLYLGHPRLLLASSALSLLVQAANVLAVWLVAQALGVSVPGSYYWIVVPMVSLLTLIPVSLNGMGVREGGMVLFLAPLGVSPGAALSLAFLWFLVFTAVSLLGGGVYLFGRFPRPVVVGQVSNLPGKLEACPTATPQVQSEHGSVADHSGQGRVRQSPAAA